MYYLIFDSKGKYVGFTTFKEFAKGIVKQRKHFQELHIEKVPDEKVKETLKMQIIGTEIMNFYDVYIFEYEEDDLIVSIFETITKIRNLLSNYLKLIKFIKLKEDDTIEKFNDLVTDILNVMEDEDRNHNTPFSECINMEKLVMAFIKEYNQG